MTAAEATELLDDVLLGFWTIMPSAGLYRRGLEIQERYGFHFYDALIVGAALEGRCTRLLSEDL